MEPTRKTKDDHAYAGQETTAPRLLPNVPLADWQDWKWQQRNRLDWRAADPARYFPDLSLQELQNLRTYSERYKLAITPYVLGLIERDVHGNPVATDPIWNQFRYLAPEEYQGAVSTPEERENWEKPSELPTKILHHKYPDRAILRVVNHCFGHCNYCYLTARVIDRTHSDRKAGSQDDWARSLEYLRQHTEIRDVLLSGGDPLILDNALLDRMLSQLRSIPSIKTIRLNTRVLTFNPFRVDRDLVNLFAVHKLTALEIHMAHPRELTREVDERLALFDLAGHRPVFLWRSPLLGGINDSEEVLEELLVKLYERRITPYYLFHYAPNTLGRAQRGVGIRAGAALLSSLRRKIPGPAFPRYALFHLDGKHDIPLEQGGSSEFLYENDAAGNPVVRFKNWRHQWVTYPDI